MVMIPTATDFISCLCDIYYVPYLHIRWVMMTKSLPETTQSPKPGLAFAVPALHRGRVKEQLDLI